MKRRGTKQLKRLNSTITLGIKYDLINTNLTNEEIANKNSVPIDIVCTILKKYKHEIDFERGKLLEDKLYDMQKEHEIENQSNETIEPRDESDNIDSDSEIDEEEEHYKREGKWQLTDNDILKIIELTEKKYTRSRISKIMKTSTATIIKYQKEFGIYEPCESYTVNIKTGKNVTNNTSVVSKTEQNESSKTINNDPQIKITVISDDDNIIKAGMIKDRHIIPCNTFIFESLKDYEIFDFDKMDETVSEFLDSNIRVTENENGELVGSKALHVYVTGLTSALSSLIKVCFEKKVNLTLLHYNHSNNTYMPQTIWNNFMKESEEKSIFKNKGSLTFYNCDLESLRNNNFYLITIVNFKPRGQEEDKTEDMIVFDDYSFVWPYYGNLINDIMKDTKRKIGIFADLCSLKDGKVNYIKRLGASSNFDFNYKEL